MLLGYVIVYVQDVAEALNFYEEAFGMRRALLHESGQFGQLETGQTSLAFTSHELGKSAVPQPYQALDASAAPVGMEITLLTREVDAAFERAVAAGAEPMSDPHDEPWGQRVCYVRDPFGTLVGIATPMG
jgi:lactoylglutathione lyase